MAIVKTKIDRGSDGVAVVPASVPPLEDVIAFALELHRGAQEWHGEFQGWQAEYEPECPDAPIDSRMEFTPANFSIGESGIWFFSLMWESGKDEEPHSFLDDRGLA